MRGEIWKTPNICTIQETEGSFSYRSSYDVGQKLNKSEN